MKISDSILRVVANFWYYDDQYPNILSCKKDILARDVLSYINQDTLLPIGASRIGLYMHIPFCKTQCLYCDCTVLVDTREAEYIRYVDCLEKQAHEQYRAYGSKIPIETLYIGGWTPSILPLFLIDRIFSILNTYYDFTFCSQRTFEASPYTITDEKIALLKAHWINRLTFWVQTLEQSVLDTYNRPQLQDETIRMILSAKKAWIPFINIDIVAGMPWQTLSGFIYTMKVISEYIDPTSMVVHPFQPTLRTPFSRMKRAYTQMDIQLRKTMRKVGLQYTDVIEKKDTYNHAKNQQLYDISYAYKSVLGLGYGAITSIPGSLKYYWESLEDYYSYFLENSDGEVCWLRLQHADMIDAYIIRALSSSWVSRDVFFDLFWIQIEKTDFFRIIQQDDLPGIFVDAETIRFSEYTSRREKMEFFLSYMNKYPINPIILDEYGGKGYADINIFLDY